MKFAFQTGRKYARDGQIINVFVPAEHDRIYFYDTARMIGGRIDFATYPDMDTERGIAQVVMSCYDHGNFEEEMWPELVTLVMTPFNLF